MIKKSKTEKLKEKVITKVDRQESKVIKCKNARIWFNGVELKYDSLGFVSCESEEPKSYSGTITLMGVRELTKEEMEELDEKDTTDTN